MQVLAQLVDTSPIPLEKGNDLFVEQFTVPMLCDFMHLAITMRNGLDISSWRVSPHQAWISLAASRTGVTKEELLTNLANEVAAAEIANLILCPALINLPGKNAKLPKSTT